MAAAAVLVASGGNLHFGRACDVAAQRMDANAVVNLPSGENVTVPEGDWEWAPLDDSPGIGARKCSLQR
jgi:hypothetical protein